MEHEKTVCGPECPECSWESTAGAIVRSGQDSEWNVGTPDAHIIQSGWYTVNGVREVELTSACEDRLVEKLLKRVKAEVMTSLM